MAFIKCLQRKMSSLEGSSQTHFSNFHIFLFFFLTSSDNSGIVLSVFSHSVTIFCSIKMHCFLYHLGLGGKKMNRNRKWGQLSFTNFFACILKQGFSSYMCASRQIYYHPPPTNQQIRLHIFFVEDKISTCR